MKSGYYKKIIKYFIFIVIISVLFFFTITAIIKYHHYKDYNSNGVNLVLISIDALRYDRLGISGYNMKTTPNLEFLLSKGGYFFKNYYVNSASTPSSHPTILSGLYLSSHGVWVREDANGNTKCPPASKKLVLLSKILKKKGYSCYAITGGGYMHRKYGLDQGFDIYTTKGDIKNLYDWLKGLVYNRLKEPFFLFLHTYEVHSPYDSPLKYSKQLTGREYNNFSDKYITSEFLMRSSENKNFNSNILKYISDRYDGGILYTDEYIKKIYDLFDNKGLLNNTVFIITTDHGEEFTEHGSFLHNEKLYEELVHVPLVVLSKKLDKRVDIREHLSSVDLMPTILKYFLNYSLPLDIDGKAFNPDKPDVRPVFLEMRDLKRGLLYNNHKLIYNRQNNEYMFFNLLNDPEEKENIYYKKQKLAEKYKEILFKKIKREKYRGDIKYILKPDEDVEKDKDHIRRLKALGYIQ